MGWLQRAATMRQFRTPPSSQAAAGFGKRWAKRSRSTTLMAWNTRDGAPSRALEMLPVSVRRRRSCRVQMCEGLVLARLHLAGDELVLAAGLAAEGFRVGWG